MHANGLSAEWLERPDGTPVTRVRLLVGADLRGLGKKIPSSDSLKARWFRTISRGERSRVRVQGRRFGDFLDLRERSSLPGIARGPSYPPQVKFFLNKLVTNLSFVYEIKQSDHMRTVKQTPLVGSSSLD